MTTPEIPSSQISFSELFSIIPKGGLAIHGTNTNRAEGILSKGLNSRIGRGRVVWHNYALLLHPDSRPMDSHSEDSARLAILTAARYAQEPHSSYDKSTNARPVIAVFLPKLNEGFIHSPEIMARLQYGKEIQIETRNIPAGDILGIVDVPESVGEAGMNEIVGKITELVRKIS